MAKAIQKEERIESFPLRPRRRSAYLLLDGRCCCSIVCMPGLDRKPGLLLLHHSQDGKPRCEKKGQGQGACCELQALSRSAMHVGAATARSI